MNQESGLESFLQQFSKWIARNSNLVLVNRKWIGEIAVHIQKLMLFLENVINLHHGERDLINFRKFMAQFAPWVLSQEVDLNELFEYQTNSEGTQKFSSKRIAV